MRLHMVASAKSNVCRTKLITLCTLLLLMLVGISCGNEEEQIAAAMTGGEPSRGKIAISRYGCSACHTIPGVRDANALVGPPLNQIASRSYIGGVLPNTPDNMIRWVQDPPAVDHLTAMPKLGVNDQDARDIASYLYTLK
jgi:cytochrome c